MNLDLLYLYILSLAAPKGLNSLESLRQHHGSLEQAFNAPAIHFKDLGWNSDQIAKLAQVKSAVSVRELTKNIQSGGISLLPYYDARYPKLLKEIPDPPAVLFYRGAVTSADEACIAVVGTRMISGYGKVAMPKIIDPLVAARCSVVSGLAYGVDAEAHLQTLKNKGRTIAVLGSGIDDASLYPRHHVRLAHEILDSNGLLLSEFPPGTTPFKSHFVSRNRIIAGMSLGSVIVECKTKSGALITADYAMDFNRAVYAVPGPIYSPVSAGPNALIRSGATLITSGEDILTDLALQIQPQMHAHQFTVQQQLVLECMQSTPQTVDALQQQTNLSAAEVMTTITDLELSGAVRNLGVEGYIAT